MQLSRSVGLVLATAISGIAVDATAQTGVPGAAGVDGQPQPGVVAPPTTPPVATEQPSTVGQPAAPAPAAPAPATAPAGVQVPPSNAQGAALAAAPPAAVAVAPPPPEPAQAKPAAATTAVVGRWALTVYGFVQLDAIWDSTSSFNEIPGSGLIARPGTYANRHDRYQVSMRNSRFGFRFKAPDLGEVKSSGVLEMDFYGGQAAQPESAFFSNPLVRLRHAYYRVETPIVDVLVGQTWSLFGWQGGPYFPNTAQTPGVRGHVFARTPQVRVSKTVKSPVITFDAAVAAVRPAQRDAGLPGGQAGLRLSINQHAGQHTVNVSGSQLVPLSIAVTGDIRRYRVPRFQAGATDSTSITGGGVAVDVFVPIIPATETDKDNSLSINGEVVWGKGITDQYTGLTGGLGLPVLPNPTGATPAPTYASNFDAGSVAFNRAGEVRLVRWTTYLVGLQYYLPGVDGRIWLAANYSRSKSDNLYHYAGTGATTADSLSFIDGVVGGEVLPGVRVSTEYAHYRDRYVDGTKVKHGRVQLVSTMVF